MASLTSGRPSCKMQSVQTALPAASTGVSPLRSSSGRMRCSLPPRMTATARSSVSRSICRLARISCTMLTVVLIRMMKMNRRFFRAPTAASATAIIRFSALKPVQMLSRKIRGIVFVALFMRIPPDLCVSYPYTQESGKSWRKKLACQKVRRDFLTSCLQSSYILQFGF